MVRAGAMRHLVRIEQRVTQQDAAGEPLTLWMLVLSRWAAIQRTPGGEAFSAQQRQGSVPTVFRMRYPVDLTVPITPDMRVVCNDRVYDVVSAIDEGGLREELVITAQELVGQTP